MGRSRCRDNKRESETHSCVHESAPHSISTAQSLINTGLTPLSAHTHTHTRHHTCALAGSLYSSPLPPLCVIFCPYVFLRALPRVCNRLSHSVPRWRGCWSEGVVCVRERQRDQKAFIMPCHFPIKQLNPKILPRPDVLQCPAVTATDTWWHIDVCVCVCVCEYAGCFVQSAPAIVCFCVPSISRLLHQTRYESLTWAETHPEWASFTFRWVTNFSKGWSLGNSSGTMKTWRRHGLWWLIFILFYFTFFIIVRPDSVYSFDFRFCIVGVLMQFVPGLFMLILLSDPLINP